ncbi:hypothetical protein JJE64_04790 [Alloprevotella tannerae]|uniref:hypothetical protein n=1 Tax=Alloprevotella tannerae TaxID=76122 RepID=UPI001EDB7912|nr:hypothetical protein [Alloprevotella tannerae]MCG2650720.1 hypothetical protein [Alloprevotella tannerae]
MMKKYVVFLLLAAVCVGSTAQRPKKRRPAKKTKTVRVEKQTERFVTEPAYRTSKVTVNKTTNGEVRNLTSAELRQQMINKEKRLGNNLTPCDDTQACSQNGKQTECKKQATNCRENMAAGDCKQGSGDCQRRMSDSKQNSEACGTQKNCCRQGAAQGECRSSENCSQQSGVKLSAEKGWISRLDFRVKNLQELRQKTDFIIVVDGKEITDNAALAAIKSSDIASVQLLQGEDTTAKYGERGKKGVLLLKTRQVEANVKAESDCSKQ